MPILMGAMGAMVARVTMVAAVTAVTVLPPLPASTVTIYRDEWGVPHIFAEREEDGFYALGYAMAEDELDYLLRLFLMARGEQAALFGSKFVDSDFLSRLWRHAEESQAGFARMSPELQRNYRGYMAGVERYLAEHPAERPAGMPKL